MFDVLFFRNAPFFNAPPSLLTTYKIQIQQNQRILSQGAYPDMARGRKRLISGKAISIAKPITMTMMKGKFPLKTSSRGALVTPSTTQVVFKIHTVVIVVSGRSEVPQNLNPPFFVPINRQGCVDAHFL